jgi:predicted MFS family arabinose efflux permease
VIIEPGILSGSEPTDQPLGRWTEFWRRTIANTAARVPAGWLIDRTRRSAPYAVGGVLAGCVATALLPHVPERGPLLALVAGYGVVSGTAGVAIGVALAGAATPAARGLVMGGYSTALYLGLALGSFALGPVITSYGYATGFGAGAVMGSVGAVIAMALWIKAQHDCGETLAA